MGLGQQYLPVPSFSPTNPYWQDPRPFWKGFAAEMVPRMSARDFLYATTWELWKWDIHGAFCVRQATTHTVRINWKIQWQSHIRELWIKQKEKTHVEKVA